MRLKDLKPLNEANDKMPHSMKYTMPQSVIIPDMDLYYEFYKFVTNMACHPEIDKQMHGDNAMRDVPVAVAYTPQEFEMIKATAERMGFDLSTVAFEKSVEPPDTQITSPVMKFDLKISESNEDTALRIGKVKEQFMNLVENKLGKLHPDVSNTISPTMAIPDLVNSDYYKQYRYTLALAAAKAVANGEVGFDAMSAWNEAMSGVAYAPQEMEIFALANKMMDVHGVMLSKTPPTEPSDTFKKSPVAKFTMFDTLSEQMRDIINVIK